MSSFIDIKPIQATPKLKGNEAVKLVNHVQLGVSKKEIAKNKFLLEVLKKIKK
ncbi:MAG: hypothetical protein E7C50_00285 [Clostridium sp.]|uniref:hypothetical protein n=1 Tax=Clostridium sp. TaxID=1506 RepID=UPI0029001FA9|nr:hypothetical protein [Clostridium sp.]MDU2674201.1 hypothetical protein [Clostridium sp.]MDU2680296.1 hypothetical protein [Clostridium sp.]